MKKTKVFYVESGGIIAECLAGPVVRSAGKPNLRQVELEGQLFLVPTAQLYASRKAAIKHGHQVLVDQRNRALARMKVDMQVVQNVNALLEEVL